MLIKCEHCIHPCGMDKRNLLIESDFNKCSSGEPSKEYAYRYRLAEQLHRAVLDRLLDPKNVTNGKFETGLASSIDLCNGEFEELEEAIDGFLADKIDKNRRRVIEECGDVAAYLAAIIDAVKAAK